jgi:hypothetical protein
MKHKFEVEAVLAVVAGVGLALAGVSTGMTFWERQALIVGLLAFGALGALLLDELISVFTVDDPAPYRQPVGEVAIMDARVLEQLVRESQGLAAAAGQPDFGQAARAQAWAALYAAGRGLR